MKGNFDTGSQDQLIMQEGPVCRISGHLVVTDCNQLNAPSPLHMSRRAYGAHEARKKLSKVSVWFVHSGLL